MNKRFLKWLTVASLVLLVPLSILGQASVYDLQRTWSAEDGQRDDGLRLVDGRLEWYMTRKSDEQRWQSFGFLLYHDTLGSGGVSGERWRLEIGQVWLIAAILPVLRLISAYRNHEPRRNRRMVTMILFVVAVAPLVIFWAANWINPRPFSLTRPLLRVLLPLPLVLHFGYMAWQIVFRESETQRRQRLGLCHGCGHDLKGCVGRATCPECGAVIPPKNTPLNEA